MHEHLDPTEIATRELVAVLASVHVVGGRPASEPDGPAVWIADPRRPMQVMLLAAPTVAQVRALPVDRPGIVVADRLAAPQRRALGSAGWSWWDRRGALEIVAGGQTISLAPVALPAPARRPTDPFSRVAGRTVGLELLRSPHVRRTVRHVARATELSVGAAGRAMAELGEAGLIDHAGLPAVPDLFDALAAAWQPRWHGLRIDAGPTGDASLDGVLRFGIEIGQGAGPGWAVVSGHALLAYGGTPPPIDTPVRLLATDDRAVAWALQRWGVEADGDLEVAVPPTASAVVGRHPWGGHGPGGTPWRLADPLVVALTLAGDRSEAVRRSVRSWDPTPGSGVIRVW